MAGKACGPLAQAHTHGWEVDTASILGSWPLVLDLPLLQVCILSGCSRPELVWVLVPFSTPPTLVLGTKLF